MASCIDRKKFAILRWRDVNIYGPANILYRGY